MTTFRPRMTQQLPPILAVKALLMTHYLPLRALAANLKLLLDPPLFIFTSTQINDALRARMNAWNADDDEELQDKLTMAEVPVGQQIRDLKAASLADKFIVLASMPIIDVFHAAMFLRITECAFIHFNAYHHDVFGQRYMNKRRYSLDELMLINSNPEWLSDYRKGHVLAPASMPDDSQFGRFTLVDEKLAMAFCNITRAELPKAAYVTSRAVPTYYLADLDKIRVAKLKAEQQ